MGKQDQLYGLAVSAKRYVVYKRNGSALQIINASEHGLGIVYVPDERKRYKPKNCKDTENSYAHWMVEAWDQLLVDHFRNIDDPENALVGKSLWFGRFPAVMRIRVTTPNVMRALRKRDPGAAKPYNFAISPILIKPPQDCTLVAPAFLPETGVQLIDFLLIADIACHSICFPSGRADCLLCGCLLQDSTGAH